MPSISRRTTRKGETRYLVQVRLKGYPPAVATFSSRADARDWARQTEGALKSGRYSVAVAERRHTLAEAIGRYCRDVKPHRKRVPYLAWWKGKLGAELLADLSPRLIAQWRDRLAERGGPRGGTTPATCNRYLAALSHVFTIAEKEWAWMESNPCRKVRRLTEPRGRVVYLSDEELGRLLESSRASRERRLYPLVVLAIGTGARQAELMGLRWSDVDLGRGSAILHHTKNGERRSLALTGLALDVVRGLAETRPAGREYLFASRRGGVEFPRDAWGEAVEAAGLEDFRFHDLRHCCASYLAMSGATAPEIAAVLGHKTLAMVKRYAHLAEQHTAAVVGRMTEKFLKPAPAPAG
ncbi:MAG TPA: site-specific integrase [Thermoanaerobaculia bacterium]|nr:site-specific integrase [Thermoanaerobaculia bacterium]